MLDRWFDQGVTQFGVPRTMTGGGCIIQGDYGENAGAGGASEWE